MSPTPQAIRAALEAYVKSQQPKYQPSRGGLGLDVTSQGNTVTVSLGSATPARSRSLGYR